MLFRSASDSSGQEVAKQIAAGNMLRDDLVFLGERGERIADRLEAAVRAAKAQSTSEPAEVRETPKPRSQAEEALMKALRLAR